MTFHKQVQLHSADGVHLRRIHAEEAERMVRCDEAKPAKRAKGKISVIVVPRCVLGLPPKPPTALTVWHYLGKPQHIREAVGAPTIGHTIALRRIPNSDRWAYTLSQTDFIAPFRAEYSRA